MKKIIYTILGLLTIGLIYFFGFLPKTLAKNMNSVSNPNPLELLEKETPSLPFMADLHCDALLWDRNLTQEVDYGHVDLPRMQKANMALQVFSIVNKTPWGINIESNPNSDQTALLSFAQLLPYKTWLSPKERTLHQIKMLNRYIEQSDGQMVLIDSRDKMADFASKRAAGDKTVGAMLGIEGAYCLDGKIENLKVFADLGVRYIGLTHFIDNEWAGSAHGEEKYGLTEAGRQLVQEMIKQNVMIDLAHVSRKAIDDIFAMTDVPVLISHTGVQAVCNNNRNLTDKHLDEIGRRNGLVGIGLWETAVCGKDAKATAQNIKYVADRIGVDKVALGSDFDGATETHFDVTWLPLIVQELQKLNFSPEDIEKIMGGNIRDFFLRNLR